jgi:hypothetical protein
MVTKKVAVYTGKVYLKEGYMIYNEHVIYIYIYIYTYWSWADVFSELANGFYGLIACYSDYKSSKS